MKNTITKHKNNIVIGLSILAIAVLIGFSSTTTTKASGGLVGASEFMTKYQATPDAVLVDVRTPEEFNAGHIEGAIVVDFDNPNFVIEIQKLDPSKTYFIYCRSGNRSGQAAVIMKRHNFQNVYDLQGGVSKAPQLLKK